MSRKLAKGTKLVVASHNPGKVWEINQLIEPFGLEAISAGALGLEEPEETEPTFAGNALLKARAAAEGANLPALADDSGLEIATLGGAPGIYSARWAGPAKDFSVAMQRVHDEIEKKKKWAGTPPAANFISVLCLAWPGGSHDVFEGRVDGHLVWPPRGGNGFGYDPIFIAEGERLTFGEMQPEEKYAISHRTRAFAKFKRECLEEASARPSRSGRDLEGLDAAARNLSTQAELEQFISNLRRDFAANGSEWKASDLSGFLEAMQASLADPARDGEPKWRAIARALLAASSNGLAP